MATGRRSLAGLGGGTAEAQEWVTVSVQQLLKQAHRIEVSEGARSCGQTRISIGSGSRPSRKVHRSNEYLEGFVRCSARRGRTVARSPLPPGTGQRTSTTCDRRRQAWHSLGRTPRGEPELLWRGVDVVVIVAAVTLWGGALDYTYGADVDERGVEHGRAAAGE